MDRLAFDKGAWIWDLRIGLHNKIMFLGWIQRCSIQVQTALYWITFAKSLLRTDGRCVCSGLKFEWTIQHRHPSLLAAWRLWSKMNEKLFSVPTIQNKYTSFKFKGYKRGKEWFKEEFKYSSFFGKFVDLEMKWVSVLFTTFLNETEKQIRLPIHCSIRVLKGEKFIFNHQSKYLHLPKLNQATKWVTCIA